MSLIRTKAFSGPTQHLTLRHPFATRSPIFKVGVPIGIDVFSHELICLDPAWLKAMNYIDSMMFAFFGVKGFGKSATLKIIAMRLGMLTAGYEEMRFTINDHKVLKQERKDGSTAHGMEYDALASLMGCVPFVMSRMRVNPFDWRICKTYSQVLAMAELLASFSATEILDGRSKRALRVAVLRMFMMKKELWSPAILLDVIRTLREEDVNEYHERARKMLFEEHTERLNRLRLTLESQELRDIEKQFQQQLDREVTLSSEETLEAKGKLFDLLDDVLSGPDAEIFGDSHSMYDMYGQRASVKQWIGFATGGNGETIMRTLDARMTSFIIENGQWELLSHLELDDELHKSMASPVSAESKAWLSKISRSVPRTVISATQSENDVLKGSIDSQHYRWGVSYLDDNGGTFLARQRGSTQYLHDVQERHSLTNTQAAMLPRLPKYTMFIKGGEEYPASLMRVFATREELPHLQTDQSNQQLLLRPGIGSIEAIEAYAKVNGVKLIGGDR